MKNKKTETVKKSVKAKVTKPVKAEKEVKPVKKAKAKKAAKKSTAPMGRPTVMTDGVVKILEEAFAEGLSDELACETAGISRQTMYDYIEKHPDFLGKKEALKAKHKAIVDACAQKHIENAIEAGDMQTIRWYAERRMKADYGKEDQKVEVAVNNVLVEPRGLRDIPTEELEKMLADRGETRW